MAHGLRRELEALGFRLLGAGHEPRVASWQPPVDVFVAEDKVVVVIEAAGIDASNMGVTYREGALVVRGYRPRPVQGHEPQSFVHMEIPHGFFERVVALPSRCIEEEISASYRDGMIVIEAPLCEGGSRRQIPIE